MKIVEVIKRRDDTFRARFECEHCSNGYVGYGIVSDHYLGQVLPNERCRVCGRSRNTAGEVKT